MELLTRPDWNAAEPTRETRMADYRQDVFVHWLGVAYEHQLTDEEILQRVQNYHQGVKGWFDIGYSWAIGRSARAFECRGFDVAGSHTVGRNQDSYGVVFLIGEGEEPTEDMWQTFTELLEHIRTEDPLMQGTLDGRVKGHRHSDMANTICPGDKLANLAWGYRHSRDFAPAEPDKTAGIVEALRKISRSLLDIAKEIEDLKV